MEFHASRVYSFPSLQQGRYGHVAIHYSPRPQRGTIYDYDYEEEEEDNVDDNTKVGEPFVLVAGGVHHETGQVLDSVEVFSYAKNWEWKTSHTKMTTPRLYAAAVVLPSERAILVCGGRNHVWEELDTVDVGILVPSQQSEENSHSSHKDGDDTNSGLQPIRIKWHTLDRAIPLGPRMAPAAVVLPHLHGHDMTVRVLLAGGYDGRVWQRSCCLYEFHKGQLGHGVWRHHNADLIPDMVETVRFPKAVVYSKYVLVLGERDIPPAVAAKTSTSTTALVIQCFDSNLRKWIWAKACLCPSTSLDVVSIQEPYLYGMSSNSHSNNNNGSEGTTDHNNNNHNTTTTGAAAVVFACELAVLDPQMLPVAVVGAVGTSAADMEAPTIVAENAVLVAECNASSSSLNSQTNNNNHSPDKNNTSNNTSNNNDPYHTNAQVRRQNRKKAKQNIAYRECDDDLNRIMHQW